jgi:hypothetical protein
MATEAKITAATSHHEHPPNMASPSTGLGAHRILYIEPHLTPGKGITIHDVTGHVTVAYDDFSDTFRQVARDAVQSPAVAAAPLLTIRRGSFWKATLRVCAGASKTEELVAWKASRHSRGRNRLVFPAGSPHDRAAQGTVEMKPERRFLGRAEAFVVGSVLFTWRMESSWNSRRFTLFEAVGGGEEVEIARFRQVSLMRAGGVLVVDPDKIDPVLAATTACVMLRKIRQRQAERSSGGGGGGGGGGG